MIKLLKQILAVVLFQSLVFGACSGSGVSWSCPSGATSADINTVITNATDGAVVTFATGTYTWSSPISPSLAKGISFICSGTCTVTSSATLFGFASGSSSKLYRFSGFTFSAAGSFLFWTCPSGGCAGVINNVRIDHNAFNGASAGGTVLAIGENTSTQYIYGAIDHNTFSGTNSFVAVQIFGAVDPSPPNSQQGTVNNMFIEDNVISVTNQNNTGSGAVDGWGPMAGMVFRNNTVTNALVTIHSAETVGGHGNGASNWEVYGNIVILNAGADPSVFDGYRSIHHQGSFEELFFNNTETPHTEPANAIMVSIAANYPPQYTGPYPSALQPARDYKNLLLYPIYGWNNRDGNNGNKSPLGDESGFPTYMQANRDYYDEVGTGPQTNSTTPFNGSSGVGFGLFSRRPASCTPTPSVLPQDQGRGGVGYFATDVGPQGSNGGRLYACTSTNTWSQWWQEYQYPHPIEGFAVYPAASPSSGTFGTAPTISITDPNSGTHVTCWTYGASPATPTTNGLGTGCGTGTPYTGSFTLSSGPGTLLMISGTSATSDSQVVEEQFSGFSAGSTVSAPATGMFSLLLGGH